MASSIDKGGNAERHNVEVTSTIVPCIVEGTHLCLLPPTARLSAIIGSNCDKYNKKEQSQERSETILVEALPIYSILEYFEAINVTTKAESETEAAYAHAGCGERAICVNSLDRIEIGIPTSDVFASDIREAVSCEHEIKHEPLVAFVDNEKGVVITQHTSCNRQKIFISRPDNARRPSNFTSTNSSPILEVENAGFFVIADFFGNGLDQILLLPRICGLKDDGQDSVLEPVSCEGEGNCLSLILRHSFLTDAKSIFCGSVSARSCKTSSIDELAKKINENSLRLESVDLRKCSAYTPPLKEADRNQPYDAQRRISDNETNQNCSWESNAIVRNDKYISMNTKPLQQIACVLRKRVIEQTFRLEETEKRRRLKWRSIESARDVVNQLVHWNYDPANISNTPAPIPSDTGLHIPVFCLKDHHVEREKLKNGIQPIVQKRRTALQTSPFELLRIAWRTLPGGNVLEMSIDLRALPQTNNDEHSTKGSSVSELKNSMEICFINVFLSVTVANHRGGKIQTQSGIIPRIYEDDCATIMIGITGISFGDSYETELMIDILWREDVRKGPPQMGEQRCGTLGTLVLPLDEASFRYDYAVIDFCPHRIREISRLSAVFDYREPCIFQLDCVDFESIAHDDAVWSTLSGLAHNYSGGRICLDRGSHAIAVMGITPEKRLDLVKLVLKYLPKSAKILSAPDDGRHLAPLHSAISQELEMLMTHTSLSAEMVRSSILKEISQCQAFTDEVASMVIGCQYY